MMRKNKRGEEEEEEEGEFVYLIVLPGLDGLERADPVLHLLPVLRAEDEPTERSDHLKEERGV